MLLPLWLLSTDASAQTLDLLGECPGPIDLTVDGLTPNRQYAIASSSGTGSAPVPAGQPCAGTVLGLSNVGLSLRGVRTAGANGGDAFTPNVPAAGCDLALQVVDLATCTTTNVYFTPRPVVGSTIGAVQQVQHATYDVVNVTGVVVATDPNGAWISNGTNNAYSGVYAYLDAGWDLVWGPIARGDVIEVQGAYTEYYGLTEVNVADSAARLVSQVTTANPPAPRTMGLAALLADPEPWEGVLLRIENVTVATGKNQYGEWSITNGTDTILVDDQIYDAGVGRAAGQQLQYVQGLLSYGFGSWRLLPREASDVR